MKIRFVITNTGASRRVISLPNQAQRIGGPGGPQKHLRFEPGESKELCVDTDADFGAELADIIRKTVERNPALQLREVEDNSNPEPEAQRA